MKILSAFFRLLQTELYLIGLFVFMTWISSKNLVSNLRLFHHLIHDMQLFNFHAYSNIQSSLPYEIYTYFCSWSWSIFTKKVAVAVVQCSHIWHESGNILEVIELRSWQTKKFFTTSTN